MPQYSGVWSLQQQMQALTSGRWATDPLFDYTTLLLQGDAGANGAQNNVFYDTSPNQFAITRNGNTTQGTFSPFSATGWSNFFDGTGDYLTSTVSSVGSSGDLTIEGWVYPTASGVRRTFFFVGSTGTFDLNLFTEITTANVLRFLIRNDSVIDILDISSTATVSANTWSHVAFVLSGTSATIYLNGVSVATGTLSGARTGTFTTGSIGALLSGGATHYFNGYISNLRYVKGTAVYTAAFTPPTAPLTAITNTSLLTCQSNRFIDNSSNAYTITRNGDTSVQAFSPFAPQFQYTASGTGGSGYFDGSDYLTTPDSTAYTMGNGDFTIEFWGYVSAYSDMRAYGQVNSVPDGNTISFFGGINGSNKAYSGVRSGVTEYACISTNNWPLGQWVHHVLTRNGTTVRQYINGVQDGTAAVGTITINDSANLLAIGRVGEYNALYWNGYISSLRITKGACLYPNGTTFTPPTAPFTTTVSSGTVSLLTNFTNAGILDGTMKNNLETVGNASVSTSVVKYGSGSMYFDGTGDRLVAPASQNTAFRTGDFTIEFWAYPTSSSVTYRSFIDTRSGSVSTGISIWQYGLALEIFGSAQQFTAASALTINTWQHVAVVRLGTTVRVFVNGNQIGSSYTNSSDMTDTRLVIADDNTSTYPYIGYLDDFRITKGIARYTQNFIPPSVALPRQ